MTLLAANAPKAEPGQPVSYGRWSRGDHLLAVVIDELRGASWQRGGDANAPRPEPFPRPGIEPVAPVSPSRKRYLDKVRAGQGTPTK